MPRTRLKTVRVRPKNLPLILLYYILNPLLWLLKSSRYIHETNNRSVPEHPTGGRVLCREVVFLQ